MMRFCLLFLFFLSYPLFAQDSMGTLSQSAKAQETPLNEMTAAFLLQQLQKETVLLKDSIEQPSLFARGVMVAYQGAESWVEPFNPGKVFNRCGSLIMSIKCFFLFCD